MDPRRLLRRTGAAADSVVPVATLVALALLRRSDHRHRSLLIAAIVRLSML